MDLERISQPMGNKPALVLVDMINGFTDGSCPLGTDCPEVVEANRQLLEFFRSRNLPVYFTTVVHRTPDQAVVFRARMPDLAVLTPESHWVQVDPRLAMQPGEVLIEKCWASSFFKTDLAEQLNEAGVDSLVVTGLTTSGCVRATVVDALQSDFVTFVAEDACGDRNPDAHKANLFDMHAKYADVMPSEQIIKLITKG
ncbi:isochorismatase family protein [Paraferrimonas sedimenticola]|uniref:N-carbamoylsarcosine amidase n=1 Tax=Paraferrimonas sedimenticola TaxID=375674 RepID=A0AA37W0Z7_9GAMM|nr:isochorismatase family protein [Paraferrimonas sedimenticola]GLP96373.1 N-carbamoylsarcosine amidase [Paraferrimonas sedimenticola]